MSFEGNLNIFFKYSDLWKLDIKFCEFKVMTASGLNFAIMHYQYAKNLLLWDYFTKSRSSMKSNIDQAKKQSSEYIHLRVNLS